MTFSNGSQWIPYPPVPRPYEDALPSPIPYPPGGAYMSELDSLLESAEVMEKNGYVLQQLTETALEQKRRCASCNQSMYSHFRLC